MTWWAGGLVLVLLSHTCCDTSQGALSKPRIALNQKMGVYYEGEYIRISCSRDDPTRNGTVHLYRDKQLLLSHSILGGSNNVTFAVNASGASGFYWCQHAGAISGKWVTSPYSRSVRVFVTARPAAPDIAPDASWHVFVDGEEVRVICTAPPGVGRATFLLFRGGSQEAVATETSSPPARAATFDVTLLQGLSIQHYSCAYVTSLRGRMFRSEHSPSLKVVVEIALVRPHLNFAGVARTLEVGEPAGLVCGGAFQDRDSTFYLHKEGREQPLRTGQPRDLEFSVTFQVADLVVNATELYTCAYRRRLYQRTVLSGRSNTLAVTARNPLSKPELVLDVNSGIYWFGQPVKMTCEGEVREPLGFYFFYRDGKQVSTGEPDTSQTVRVLGPRRGGVYRCKYTMPGPGNWFVSPLSDGVLVTEIGDLPRPMISLEGGEQEFLEGASVRIRCTAPSTERGRKFYLYQTLSTSPLLSKKARPGHVSVTFHVQNVARGGNHFFRCAYRRREEGRERFSERSELLEIDARFL